MITAGDRVQSRAGVALIELVLALTLCGLLFLGARLMVDAAGDAGTRFTRHARTADAEANGDRLLRALVTNAEAVSDTTRPFAGSPEEASFESWCDRPAGWSERCRVALSLDLRGDTTRVVAAVSTGEQLVLRACRGRCTLRYYGPGERAEPAWLVNWGVSITAPYAIGIVSEGDTLVLRLGDRG